MGGGGGVACSSLHTLEWAARGWAASGCLTPLACPTLGVLCSCNIAHTFIVFTFYVHKIALILVIKDK